jgi:hypothetical protein
VCSRAHAAGGISDTELEDVVEYDCPHMPDGSCVSDFIDAHPNGATLDEIADVFGVVRETVRQIEMGALARLRAHAGPVADGSADEAIVRRALWRSDRTEPRARRRRPDARY